MYTTRDGKPWFVLIDFDLAVRVNDDGEPQGPTSRHRTGTLPYMAYELLEDVHTTALSAPFCKLRTSLPHRVNFDFQSVTLVAIRCAIKVVAKNSDHTVHPDAKVFLDSLQTGTYKAMANFKKDLLRDSMSIHKIPFSPSFESVKPCLEEVMLIFRAGINKLDDLQAQLRRENKGKVVLLQPTPREADTMYGEVTLEKLLASLNALDEPKEGSS